jgi:DNA polymerase
MPRTIILDFETYFDSDYSLRKLSVPEYIHDRRFKVHGLAVDNGKQQLFIPPDDIGLFLKTVQQDILVFHNAFFDAAILRWHYDFQPAYMLDTLLMANHVLGSARDTGQRNDLATLANRLGIEAKGKELETVKGVRNLDETQFNILAEYAKRDARITRKVYNHLFAQMTNVEFELWLMDHTLRIYTDKLLAVDLDKIKATIQLVQKRRVEVVKASGVTPEVLASNKQFAAELTARLKTAGIPMPMKTPPKPRKDGVKSIPALAKLDAGFIALSDSPADAVRNLVRGRLVERSASTAIARLTKMKMFHGIGGIPVHLVYYGAHTGRFSGGGGFNFQNLTSPARATDSVDREIASSIREAFSPGEGNVFVACDAAQIEARVLAWLAGEDQITETFRQGGDIYSPCSFPACWRRKSASRRTPTPRSTRHT